MVKPQRNAYHLLARQRGAYHLGVVALIAVLVAGAAMAALFSLRYERNLFAEGMAKLSGAVSASPASQLVDGARARVAGAQPGDGALRKCLIDGKAVVSNTDCKADNQTSKVIKIVDTQGVQAPKQPVLEAVEARSDPALDKIIEKQMR